MTSTYRLEVWNDSRDVDHLWTNGNLGEAIPDVMTPATWSAVSEFVSRALVGAAVPGHRAFGRIGGRIYLDLSVLASIGATFGISAETVLRTAEPIFGTLPAGTTIPLVRLPKVGTAIALGKGAVVGAVRARTIRRNLDGLLAGIPDRCAELHRAITDARSPAELADLWSTIGPLFATVGNLMDVVHRIGSALASTPKRLAAMEPEMLTSAGAELASLGPLLGLAALARGELDWAGYAQRYGHRGPHEFELSMPRPAEDPGWRDAQLALLADAVDPADLLAAREAARAEALRQVEAAHPRRVTRVRRALDRWAAAARMREQVRSEAMRVFWVIRAFVLRAGELTGLGEDAFFLSLDETIELLHGRPADADIALRKATYAHYVAMPPPPPLVRGSYDTEVGAVSEVAATGQVAGTGASPGVVEGLVRVLPTVEDGAQLRPGEVLVTAVTNVGWTPLFPRAAAVVTDTGALLSHAAIVARELGIPAVVGCRDATSALRTGMRVRVDGRRGTVTQLE
ncbi:PEP-utilizing enzyme [Pseudonocardia sp. TRM90224]|uniref:PEP-utilizing enzyme n=1 Tax=Pseudonocardia sp. TRM90224 TaxID=2812678 RepID=UPI001E418B5C|nr:PEP-utilizing enzyme [Pseudonocardia sp. TRM90224]